MGKKGITMRSRWPLQLRSKVKSSCVMGRTTLSCWLRDLSNRPSAPLKFASQLKEAHKLYLLRLRLRLRKSLVSFRSMSLTGKPCIRQTQFGRARPPNGNRSNSSFQTCVTMTNPKRSVLQFKVSKTTSRSHNWSMAPARPQSKNLKTATSKQNLFNCWMSEIVWLDRSTLHRWK